jgi:hypothetical protein
MARAQGAVEMAFPGKSYTVWIDRAGRHVSVRFGRGVTIEGMAPTWTGAIEDVAKQRKEKKP